MPVDPVNNRHGMTVEEFQGLSSKNQTRVIEAKMMDKMVASAMKRATKAVDKTVQKMKEVHKG